MAITAEKLRVEVEGDTSKAQEALGELEEAGSSIPNWVGSAKGALAGLFGIGAGAGLALTAGLVGSISGAEAANKVAASLDLTKEQSARVGQVSGELFANNYGESMGEVSTAVEAVMSSVDGFKDANAATLKAAGADVMNFAKAYGTDVETAAQIAGQAVRQGLAPDFQTAMDLMTKASSQVPVAVRGDLLDAVDEYGGFFTQLGLSGEESFAALARGAQDGMYGIDKTGDALKELTIRATDGSKLTTDAYKAMGLSAGDMSNAILAGGDKARGAFDQIIQGILGIKDPTEQANTAIALFGTPLEDLSTGEIPKFLQSLTGLQDGLGETEGATARMGETLNSGPGAALETLKRQVMGAVIGFTDRAIPAITAFATAASTQVGPAAAAIGSAIGGIVSAIGSMVSFIQANSTVFSILAGIIAAVFIPALIAMGVQATIAQVKVVAAWVAQRVAAITSVAAQSLAMAQTAAGWIAMGVQAAAGAARVVAGWVLAGATAAAQGAVMVASMAATAARVVAGWVLMGVQAMLQAARMAAAWLIAMGPVGWVIAAVVGLVALIIANWDKIRAVTVAVFSAVSAFVSQVWAGIVSWVSGAVNNVRAVVARVMAVIGAAWRLYWTAIGTVARTVWNAIKSVVTNNVNAVKAVVARTIAAIRSGWTSTMNGIKAVASSIWAAIKAVVSGAIANVKASVAKVSGVIATVRNAFTSAKTAAQGALNGLVGFVRGIPGTLVGILAGAVGRFRNAGASIINGLKNGIMGAFGNVKAAVSNGLAAVRNLLPFSPAKEGPFSGKGWTLYSGRSIPEAFAQGIQDRMKVAKRATMNLMRQTQQELMTDQVTGLKLANLTRVRPGTPGATAITAGIREARQNGTTFTFNTYNPVAEKESVTVNKTLQRAAGLGW